MRRLSRAMVMASMRPPIAEQLLLQRPSAYTVNLTDKRVVITGASSGIGEAAAILFAQQGATVVAVARRQDLLDAVAQRITTDGGSAIALPCDLSDLDAVDEAVKTVEDRLGGVDILVNNAARSIRRPLVESLDRWHDVERTMALNYYAPLRLDPGLRARHAAARRRAHHQRRDVGCVQRSLTTVRGLQRVEGGAVVGEPGDRNRVVGPRCAIDHAVLPARRDTDDRSHQGVPGLARADPERSRGVDDHRSPTPPRADSTTHIAVQSGARPRQPRPGHHADEAQRIQPNPVNPA